MKKILIISTVGLIYDGITSVILSYLQAMNLEGLDVSIVGTIEIKEGIRQQIENIGGCVVELPNRKTDTFLYFNELTKYIRKNHIDVIHAHGNSGTLAIEMLAGWLGGCKKRIAHSHNTKCNQVKMDKLLRPIFNTFYTEGLACGEGAGRWLFGNRKYSILTNGRDLDKYRFNPEIRKSIRHLWGIDEEIAIGHVGGFFEQKNHIFLIEIYKEIKRICPACRLFMIGDGPLRDEIEKKCEGLEVIFTGTIDNVQEYLSALDGMLLPSLFEGLPLVAVEWQINGLPSILSDSVTKECKLTDNIDYLPLTVPAKKWAELIVQKIKRNNRQKCADQAYEILNDSIYNIKKSAKDLERLYRN